MFLNRNTNYTASSVAIHKESRTLLNNSIENRKRPRDDPGQESDVSNCQNQCAIVPEPMSQNDFNAELQVKKRRRLPKFLDIINPTIIKTYNTILYSDVIGAKYASYHSFLASYSNATVSITSNYVEQGSPSNFTIFLSNLQPQTGYNVLMTAFNNFGQASYTLPTVITNIGPPVFPTQPEILYTVTYNSIAFSNIFGASNVADTTEYFLTITNSGFPVTTITSNIRLQGVADGAPSNVLVDLFNLRSVTTYFTTLFASNISGITSIQLPSVRTAAASPIFPPQTSITSNARYNLITYSNILPASNPYDITDIITYSGSRLPYLVTVYSSSNIAITFSNLTQLTLYNNLQLIASNTYAQATVTLPPVTTLAGPPSFETLTGYTFSRGSNTIGFSNITGASNIDTLSQYSITLSNASGPVNGFTCNIVLTYCNIGAPSNVNISLSNLTPSTTYFTTLIATNESGSASNILSNITTLVAAPSFDTLTGYTFSSLYNTITFTDIRGASSIATSSQYSIELSNESGPVGGYSSDIFLTYCNVGEPSNVNITISDLTASTTYFTTLIATNESGVASNILSNVTTLIAPPTFDNLTGYTFFSGSNTITFLNISGASNIETASQYYVLLSNTFGPLSNSEYDCKIDLTYVDVGSPSNVGIALNRLTPLTRYFTTLVASNVSGTASNILVSVDTTSS